MSESSPPVVAPQASPPTTIGPFSNVPAPGSPIRSDWCQSVSTYITNNVLRKDTAPTQVVTSPVTFSASINATAITATTGNLVSNNGSVIANGTGNSSVGGQLIAGTNVIAGATPSASGSGSVIRGDGLLMSTVTFGTATSLPNLVLQRTGAPGPQDPNGRYIEFRRANTADVIGRVEIQTGGTTVAYLTSSDRRLKDERGPITDAVERLSLLVPRRFTWKTDPDQTEVDGFFADEVQPVVPEAVSGEPDAVDPESGRIVAQALDASKLVPLLVAAVQELAARLAALEAA